MFFKLLTEFLIKLSRYLQAAVTVKRDENGHMKIFEWSIEKGRGKQIDVSRIFAEGTKIDASNKTDFLRLTNFQ